MKQVATIITGAEKRFEPIFRRFGEGLLKTDRFDLIQVPGAEVALARVRGPQFSPVEAQFAVRDIIETRARDSCNHGSLLCVIVAQVACNQGAPGYDECVRLVKREREEVRKWGFREFMLACFTPTLSIEPIIEA
jgi:hypothetical protein